MRIEHGQVPEFPRITAKILEDTRAKVTVNGVEHPVSAEGISGTRAAVVALMAETAKKLGRPVKALIVDHLGEWPLVIYEDGLVENDSSMVGARHRKSRNLKANTRAKGQKKRRPFLARIGRGPDADGPVQGVEEGFPSTQCVESTTTIPASEGIPSDREGESGSGYPFTDTPIPGESDNGKERTRAGGPQQTGETPLVLEEAPEASTGEGTVSEGRLATSHGEQLVTDGESTEIHEVPLVDSDAQAPMAEPHKKAGPVHGYSVFVVPRNSPGTHASPRTRNGEKRTEGRSAEAIGPPMAPTPLPGDPLQHDPQQSQGRAASPLDLPPGPDSDRLVDPLDSPTTRINREQAANAWEAAILEHNRGRVPAETQAFTGLAQAATAPLGTEQLRPGGFQRFLSVFRRPSRFDHADFVREVQLAIPTHRRVTVLSLKGGVGKTTATVLLGSYLASARESRVVAVDTDRDRGTLRDRVILQHDRTLHDLSDHVDQVNTYSELRQFVSVNDARLHALVSSTDPISDDSISGGRYRSVTDLLGKYYDLLINDCGTGLKQPGMREVLELTDQVIIVLEESLDAMRSAESTFLWLAHNGYQDLAKQAIVVVSRVDRKTVMQQETRQLENRLVETTGGFVRIPYDEHLAEGGVVHLDRLQEQTRDACRHLTLLAARGLSELD